jgi:hypothetical protein
MTNTERADILETVRSAVLEVELPPELLLPMSQRPLLARYLLRAVARRLETENRNQQPSD